jgi:hypothetical protein
MISNMGAHRLLAAIIAVAVTAAVNVGWLKGMDRDAAAATHIHSA